MKFLGQTHNFYLVPDNFPLIEEGIIGVPFLNKYKYQIDNNRLTLNDFKILFQKDNTTIQPGQSSKITKYLDGKPVPICFINNGKRIHQISNEIDKTNDDIELISKFASIIRTKHIDPVLRDPIEKILVNYLDVFNLETDLLPCTNLTEHNISLKSDKPINIKSYRPPECHKQEIENQINDMLTKQIIEPSDSPYNAPVWVVPKKSDASGKQKWRIVIDFRKLNELTDQDAYPLPNSDEILDHLGKSKFFSALDLSSGFHQIPMNKDSKKYTAFSTPQGHFHYNRMPFGLKNAPATFQRMMDTALRGLVEKHCFVYLDDIIIFGSTIQEHNTNLAIVLQRLRELGLKIQPDKCEFLKPELEYLGHVVTKDGVKPNQKKIEAVTSFKIPNSPTNVKSFLGLVGYYRKFIRNFSKIAKPLTDLTKKDNPFHWTETQQNAFDTLKQKLCEAPILKYPDFDKTFTLTTDASNEGLGAILSQDGHPCSYVSRTLNAPEKNYSTTEKELLAIVWAIKRFRQYLLGRKFIIQTDHQALKWLKDIKDPSSRLMRWRLRLEEYDYEIEYKKGKENTAADALSRLYPLTEELPPEDTEHILSGFESTDYHPDYEHWKTNITPIPLAQKPNRPHFFQITKELLGLFDEKKWINKLAKILNDTQKTQLGIGINDSEISNLERVHIQMMTRFLTTKFPQLKITFSLDPPREYTEIEKEQILKENHNEICGHLGIQRTLKRIQENHHWIGIEKNVEEFVKNCETCQREKLVRIRQKEEAVITDTPVEPNQKIAMDIFGPLTKTKKGNQFILSIQDQLTKYLVLVPLKDQQANSIISELLEHYVYIFSAPKQILTDQGANFVCKLMETFEQAFKIQHIKTTSFHPQSNGSLERTHSTIKDLIKTCTLDRQNDWDENLKLICMGYNTSVHETTGHTPFELTFGHKANMPSTISATPSITKEQLFKLWKTRHDTYIQKAIELTNRNKQRYLRDQNRRIIKLQTVFNTGDKVFMHNDHKRNKLDHEWLGPYEIIQATPPNYTLKIDENRTQKIHGNRLKLFISGRRPLYCSTRSD